MTTSSSNPYLHSELVNSIKSTLEKGEIPKIAFLDIDSTLTGDLTAQKDARDSLEAKGYDVVFVTARTSEMCMSFQEREKSSGEVKERPPAKLLYEDKTKTLQIIDPVQVEAFRGLLNPTIIISTNGTEVLIRQEEGGYQVDSEYSHQESESTHIWRQNTLEIISKCKTPLILSPAEDKANYDAGKWDVSLPPYRIEIDFKNEADKNNFIEEFNSQLVAKQRDKQHEVKIWEEYSLRGDKPKFALYLMPPVFGKEKGVDWVMKKIKKNIPNLAQPVEILIAGDAFADMKMGLESAAGEKVTFLVPGEAKLGRYLLTEAISILKPSSPDGYFNYTENNRVVIIGDKAYPGKKGPETILDYLKTQK